MDLTRRTFLSGAAAVAAGAAAPASALAAAGRSPRRPNLVVILADDLGYGALGAYGQETLQTPHLDRMAREGVAFTDFYSGAPMCAPSRCVLLTGLHTGHALVRDNSFTTTGIDPALLPQDTTWAEMLQRGGYATGAFGKWGFGSDGYTLGGDVRLNAGDRSHPPQKGFDEFVGLVTHGHATNGYFPTHLWDGNRRVLYPENANDARETYAPDVYMKRALGFITRNRQRPFAVLIAPQLVHWPNLIPTTEPYSDMPWTEEMKRYAAMYTLLDSYVGRVLDTVRRIGLANDTLVLFTSDNGSTTERGMFGSGWVGVGPSESVIGDTLWNISGGLRSEKHSLYEAGIRVPMVVWGPGIVRRAGRQSVAGRPWASWDLLPTLVDFAGVRPPSDVDGVSVRGWITGEREVRRGPLYWERPPYDSLNVDGSPPTGATFGQAVRRGRWKAFRWPLLGADPHTDDSRWRFELYDLEEDRGETTDVSLDHPGVRAELEEFMRANHADPPYPRASR